jgi:hypothetical protein
VLGWLRSLGGSRGPWAAPASMGMFHVSKVRTQAASRAHGEEGEVRA